MSAGVSFGAGRPAGGFLATLSFRFATPMQSGVQKPEVVDYIWRSLDKHHRGRSGGALNTRPERDGTEVSKVRKLHSCLNVVGRSKAEA